MTIDRDSIELIFWASFFGLIFYYVMFRAPASDRIYSSDVESQVNDVKVHLEQNGIRTYVKSRSPYRLKSYGGRANPSLHVVDPKDKENALRLIRSMPAL
jgi:hypothetical protein